jgi:hypothetical protein
MMQNHTEATNKLCNITTYTVQDNHEYRFKYGLGHSMHMKYTTGPNPMTFNFKFTEP